MNAWSRRLIIFALVLAAAVLAANKARRLTAHASMDAAVSHTVVSAAAPALPAAHQGVSTPVPVHPAIMVARTPPAMKAPAPKSLSSESPRSTLAASSPSPAAITAVTKSVRTFHDKNYKVSFDYPANWTFTQKDHEISTFRLDARTADRKATLRAVTAIPENPYPASTFTGAYIYLSVIPHSSQSKCSGQAAVGSASKVDVSRIGGTSFAHGHDEQKHICTVERDEIYTTYRKGACFRFDLAINNFCGGEVSGVKDVTQQELDTVRERMEAIVSTVRFDPK